MTTNLAPLLAAILREPAEDHYRMVYADALDDAGQHEHAEFIREGCREPSAKQVPWHAWTRYPYTIDAGWARGFIHTLRGPLAAMLEHGPAICREHPVEKMEVTPLDQWHEFIGGSHIFYAGADDDE